MKLSRMIRAWPGSLLFRSPFTCNIKVTTRCNLRCGFCGLWSRPADHELHLDNYRYIADLLHDIGIGRVVITGGEPLLRADTPEIIALFSRRGISTTLLTNGLLLNKDILQRMLRLGLNDIGISLDSLIPEKQEAICNQHNVWDRIVKAIKLSVEQVSNGVVEVLTTVTADNLREVPDLVRYVCDELGAWSVVNPVNIPPSPDSILSATDSSIAPPYPEELVDSLYDSLLDMKQHGKRILISDRFIEDSRKYLKTGQFKWHCDAGERYFTIFPDGGLAPCSDQASVARITDMTPADFRSRKYRNTVRDVQKRCGGCIFSCWREASYLFNDSSVWKERIRSIYRIIEGR